MWSQSPIERTRFLINLSNLSEFQNSAKLTSFIKVLKLHCSTEHFIFTPPPHRDPFCCIFKLNSNSKFLADSHLQARGIAWRIWNKFEMQWKGFRCGDGVNMKNNFFFLRIYLSYSTLTCFFMPKSEFLQFDSLVCCYLLFSPCNVQAHCTIARIPTECSFLTLAVVSVFFFFVPTLQSYVCHQVDILLSNFPSTDANRIVFLLCGRRLVPSLILQGGVCHRGDHSKQNKRRYCW